MNAEGKLQLQNACVVLRLSVVLAISEMPVIQFSGNSINYHGLEIILAEMLAGFLICAKGLRN